MSATPTINHKLLTKPQQRLAELERELAAARKAAELERAKAAGAEKADREAAELARLDGKERPAPTAEAATARHEAAEMELAELEGTVARAKERLDEAITANRSEIHRDLQKALAEDRAAVDRCCDQLTEALERLKAHRAEDIAAGGGKYLPNAPLLVPGLPKPNGDDRSAIEVLDAIRVLAEAPKPKVQQATAPPLSQSIAGRGVFAAGGGLLG
jgi:hypothetical protein